MSSSYTSYNALSPNPSAMQAPTPEMSINGAIGTPTPSSRGRARGGLSGTGAKRGRKPRGGTPVGSGSPRIPQSTAGGTPTPTFTNQQYSHVHWALPSGSSTQANNSIATSGVDGSGSTPQGNTAANATMLSNAEQQYQPQSALQPQTQQPQPHAGSFPGQQSTPALPASGSTTGYSMPSAIPTLDTTGLISFASTNPPPVLPTASSVPLPRPPFRPTGVDDDGEGEDELLPAMADDDYSAQLSWQSQSKDNLKWVHSSHSTLGIESVPLLTFLCFAGS
jgi:transcription initiation factor TFIID subunit 11